MHRQVDSVDGGVEGPDVRELRPPAADLRESRRASRTGAAAAGTPRAPDHPLSILRLQRAAGNQAVAGLLGDVLGGLAGLFGGGELSVTDEFVPDPEGGAPDTAPRLAGGFSGFGGFHDEGMVGTVPFGDGPDSLHVPHAFTDGGMTGTVVWSGGGGAGARGNQNTGSLQTQIPPTYTASAGPAAGKFSSAIDAGTGKVAVTRSWLGAFTGNQGNGWFLTANAVSRINQHERNHVASTRGFYTTHLTPLETRIANAALGQNAGNDGPGAIAAHQAAVRWATTITAFQTADVAANKPGGTIDSADVAAGWITDNGPGKVAGVDFQHIVTRTGEAMPAAAAP